MPVLICVVLHFAESLLSMNSPPIPPCPFEKFHPSALTLDDQHFMMLAFNLAIDAWNANEVPIGAIITVREQRIAAAHNSVESAGDPTAHAEILAITQASQAIGDWRLNEATLYVTKEPCPMCAGATVMARLGRVVYGAPDPKMGCLGGATPLHTLPHLNHRVNVTPDVLVAECTAILQAFFQQKRQTNRPALDECQQSDKTKG